MDDEIPFSILAASAAFLIAGCAAEPTEPEQVTTCYPPTEMAAALAQKYGESPIWIGAVDDETATVLFIGPQSWSVVSSTAGEACLLAFGTENQVIR